MILKCLTWSVYLASIALSPGAASAQEMTFPGKDWQEATPESQGVDSTKLRAAVEYLADNAGRDGVKELVIIRNGVMIFKGGNIDKQHGVWSLTKSFTSTVLGLLIDDGKAKLDTRAKDHVRRMAASYPTVTLRHFATMTSGYYAVGDEPRGSYAHGPSLTPFAPSGTPLFTPPGSRYAYWDSAMNQFANVLTQIAGEPIEELLKRRIADPIGMDRAKWDWGDFGEIGGTVVNGGSGNHNKHVSISARELARLGHLFLNRGNWRGKQLLSASWVDAATSAQVSASTPLGHASSADGRGVYGYNWWTNGIGADGKRKWPSAPPSAYAASGYNNNEMFVIPDWKMVAVRLGLDQRDKQISDATYGTFLRKIGDAIQHGGRAALRARGSPPGGRLEVNVSQNTTRLTPYQVFELTFQHEGKYHSPTWDVTIDVRFTSPSGKKAKVGGFFYGSSKPQKPIIKEVKGGHGGKQVIATWPCDPADLWKARYAPSELGRWKFDYVFRNDKGQSAAGKGSFEVVRGRVHQKGWVRINPKNPFRFVFEDGSPYFPIGFQDGVFDNNANGSCLDTAAMEGPFRPDPEGRRPKPPPGALFARGPSMNPVNGDVDFGRHARAGFNLWRFSPNNFSIKVFTLDEVNWQEAALVDELARMMRKYDIRFFYGIFGFTRALNDHADDREGMAKVKRIIKYSVDRWGAYVDFWELFNEQKASTEWYRITTAYLKSIDPYHKPVATSWERPELEGIDLSAPHWYGNEDEVNSDRVTADRAARDKRFGKPVVYGEQGNSRGGKDRSAEGIGGVWDPGSARRMRVRCWTALFREIHFIFWETSYAKDGHYMNLWIGPEERQYIRAMQDFAYRLDADVKIADVPLAGPGADEVRAYGLRSDKRVAVYLHHFSCGDCASALKTGRPRPHRWDHRRGEVERLRVTVDVPQPAKGYWYNPRDAAIIKRFDAPAGRQTLTAPPFAIDLALLITIGGPPDVDGDGKPNDLDDDDDNDGVPDKRDAFALEREESADADADRIGDNFDADLDADGRADDRNRNGVPDNQEPDPDGDGVNTANAVPWDAFPRDPDEWRDTDGDGIGDKADQDDDGDGYSDQEERRAGTDPLDQVSFPAK